MSVGEPENRENYEVFNKDNVYIYVVRDFPQEPPKIYIQLKSNRNSPPRLVASRRR
ncbi:MAG: hypothetical protein ACOY31_02585 [Bacillota bacterium]